MKLEAYFLTVALQAGIISLCCLLVALCIRQARRRAGFALTALLATALLSWVVLPLAPKARAIRAGTTTHSVPVQEPTMLLNDLSMARIPLSLPGESQTFATGEDHPKLPSAAQAYRPKPSSILLMFWFSGALVGFGVVLLGALRIGRWLRSMDMPGDEEWAAIRSACPEAAPRDVFRLGSNDIGPALAGVLKPRIILPRFLLASERRTELAWALRHELSHRGGHDSRWAMVAQLIRAAFWWNPAVHLLHRLWASARERVCDRTATLTPEERAAYGHFLVSLAGKRPACVVAMAAASKRRLGRRIVSLLDAPAGPLRASSRWQKFLGVSFVLLALLLATRFGFMPRVSAGTAVDARSELEQIMHPEKMMMVSMAVVVSPEPFAENGQRFDADSLAKHVSRYKEKMAGAGPSGFSLVPGPGFIGPLHRTLWTNPDDGTFARGRMPEPKWDESCPLKHSNGWQASHSYRPVGDKFEVSLHAAYSFVPGHHPAPCYVFPGQQASPKMMEVEQQAMLASGDAVTFTIGEVEPGVHVSLVLGLTAIDPWEVDVARKTKYFPTLEIDDGSPLRRLVLKEPSGPRLLDCVPMQLASPERDELNRRILLAADHCPANAELVAQRDLQGKILAEKPGDPCAQWKLWRLQGAIERYAEKDPAVQALFAERERLYEPARRAMAEEQKGRLAKMPPESLEHFRELMKLGPSWLESRVIQIEPVESSGAWDLERLELKRKREQWEYERRRHEW